MNEPKLPWNRAAIFLTLATLGLGWDLYSKHAVFRDLGVNGFGPWERTWFSGWMTFRLRTIFNHGALWGMGQGMSWLFALLSLAAASGIVYWLFARKGAQSLWLTVALSFIMAGTLGNLFDRLGYHHHVDPRDGRPILAVRDFLLFTFGEFHWPVFNFADVFLVTGAVMLVLQSLRAEMAPAGETAAAPKPESPPTTPTLATGAR